MNGEDGIKISSGGLPGLLYIDYLVSYGELEEDLNVMLECF